MQKCGFLLKKNEKVLSKQVLWESRAIGSLFILWEISQIVQFFCGKLQNRQGSTTLWTTQRVITERQKNGIKNCLHCKAIDKAILEVVFLEAFELLAGNFDDVLDIVM